MDEAAREAAYAAIVAAEGQGVRWAVQAVDHARIDEINILQVRHVRGARNGGVDPTGARSRHSYLSVSITQATMEAMRGALATAVARHGPTDAAASYALVDGNRCVLRIMCMFARSCAAQRLAFRVDVHSFIHPTTRPRINQSTTASPPTSPRPWPARTAW